MNLPHDWAVELPFDPKADAGHGFKPVGPGFPTNSVAWYRRTFELAKEDDGKRLWLEFDGVFRDCTVFVNGWFVGHHESGYSSFRYDITDVARYGGKNTVAVRVDASQFEGWFYEGAGIYRHVWLVKTAPLAIAPDGIFVFSEFKNNVPEGDAVVHVETRLSNQQTNDAYGTVHCELISPSGQSIAKVKRFVQTGRHSEIECHLAFDLKTKPVSKEESEFEGLTHVYHIPMLWSPESPKLYKLITTVESDGKIVDRVETEFGIRTVAFDATNGFLLNGKPYVLKGTCNHQDHAGVGSALPDGLQYFRIARLKEMGCNAYRTAHGPPTPELLEACDRLGMLVMDENRLLGSDEANLAQLEGIIHRDRNHPSVVIWCIGNEERSQTSATGGRVAGTMQRLIKQLDPTRPVTYAASVGNVFKGINEVIEVRGWNYHIGATNMDAYHAAHPTQPNVGTEQASTVTTRGIYANDKTRGYVSAYDVNTPEWADRAEAWWNFFAARPWLSGGFVWTGFDYRGEPTPYSWPCISSHFGILDTCGFRKDSFYFYQSWWSDKTVLHLLPHWNWPGREGEDMDVWAYSNCEEVELFLNGQSLGKQTMPRNSHLSWKVKYAPDMLSAKGYNGGQVVAETNVETTCVPASIQLTAEGWGEITREPQSQQSEWLAGITAERDKLLALPAINANGEDLSIVTAAVTDAQGRVVPTATNLIQFELTGSGRILGVGNGDPSCHEPDVCEDGWKRSVFNGLAQIIVQSSKEPGEIKLTARAEGLSPATLVIPTQPCTPRPAVP